MNFSALWASLQKTLIVAVTGTFIPLALAVTNAPPTGGFAAYLGAHPVVGAIFGIAAVTAHNYLSQVQTVPASQVVPPVAPK